MPSSAYRDTRNFIEYVRTLGYPRRISMDNFRAPNFELVAECLYWLFQRYDPDLARDVPFNITTEADRVTFLRDITKLLAVKGQIIVNPKRLYKADQTAVPELLKVAGFLYEAHLAAKADSLHPRPAAPPPDFLAVLKDVDVKGFRALASEITALGAKLSDGLKAEAEVLREARLRAVQRADRLDLSQVEGAVREAIGDTRDKLDELRRAVAELSEREGGLAAKLAKRQQEVKRAEERLETLQDVRPVYMDEYEKMEGELQSIFITYLERHRNLAFLEAELERHREAEEAAAAEHRRALLEMQRKFQAEEMEGRGRAAVARGPSGGAPGGGGSVRRQPSGGGGGHDQDPGQPGWGGEPAGNGGGGGDPESSDSDF